MVPAPKKSDLVGGFNSSAGTISIQSTRKAGGMTSHMEYQIKVKVVWIQGQDDAGNFEVFKWYSEFH